MPGARAGSSVLSAGAAGLCLPGGSLAAAVAGVGFPPPVPLFLSGGDWPQLGKVRKGTGGKGTRVHPPPPSSSE